MTKRTTHLLLAGTAAASLWLLPRRSRVRWALAAAAAWQAYKAWQYPNTETNPNLPPSAPEAVRTAVVQGISMYWEEHGDSNPDSQVVVLVHGVPTHPRLWRYVIPQVAGRDVRCLAWQMVGYGWGIQEEEQWPISVARQAEYLVFWLQHLGVSRAVFVGHDLGGGVVQRLAVLHPELCQGLMLTDCVAYDNWPVPPIIIAQKMSWLIKKLPPALLKLSLQASLWVLGEADSPRRSESARLHAALYDRAGGPAAFVKQVNSVNNLDTLNIASRLPDLRLPARVVWAENDMLSLESGERLAADLRAPLTRLPRAKHFTPEDHPDVIAQAINEVIAQVDQQAASQTSLLRQH